MFSILIKKQELEEFKRDNYDGQYDYEIKLLEEEIIKLEEELSKKVTTKTSETTKRTAKTSETTKTTVKTKDNELMIPTHEKIRNNNIIETGRARQRNRNDIYSNTVISCLIGKVDGDSKKDKDREYTIYLYDKDIDIRLKELKNLGWKVPAKNRLVKDLKLINEQLGVEFVEIINTKHGIAYRIAQSQNKVFFTIIPVYKLKELLEFSNKNALRLFVSISMHKDISETNYVSMSRGYLCKCMDMEPTESNKQYISRMTTSLMKLGLIDIEVEIQKLINEEGLIVPYERNYFRLTTYEEYREKGKKKRKRRVSES